MKNFALLIASLVLSVSLSEFLLGKYYSRDSEAYTPKKLLILGDSFLGKDMSVDDIIKKNQDSLNLAQSGFDPYDYLISLKKTDFKLGKVLLGIYVGNDLTGTPIKLPSKFMQFIHRRELFKLVMDFKNNPSPTFEKESWRSHGVKEYVIEQVNQGRTSPYYPELAVRDKSFLVKNLAHKGKDIQKRLSSMFSILKEIKHEVGNRGGELFIVIFPHQIQVHERYMQFWKDVGLRIPNKLSTSRVPQDKILSFCSKENLSCLDLLPIFKERSNKDLFRKFDDHFNKDGNNLAVTEIINFL